MIEPLYWLFAYLAFGIVFAIALAHVIDAGEGGGLLVILACFLWPIVILGLIGLGIGTFIKRWFGLE